MKKRLFVFFSFLLLFYACKDRSTPADIADDLGLEKLKVEDVSVLEKMDERLFCNFGEVERYSVSLTVRPKSQNSVDVLITTNGKDTKGTLPYYTCSLVDGSNEIKVILTSKKDSSNKRTYTIRINKRISTVPNESSSKIKELKVDDKDILPLLKNNVANCQDVVATKSSVKVYVLPHNPSASIEVLNAEETVTSIDANTKNVNLAFGQNEIRVIVTSEAEGDKEHIIKIYRDEDLRLKSFIVDEDEHYDEDKDRIRENTIKFPKDKTETTVKIEARLDYATITLKHNGNKVEFKNGSSKILLEPGRNGIEVIIKGKGEKKSKTYKVIFLRLSPSVDSGKLLILRADDEDVLNLLSKDNVITLPPCNNDKASLKVEARVDTGITIKVLNNGTDVSGDGIYNVPLNEGKNKIEVKLYSGTNPVETYSIFITRFPPQLAPNAPNSDEVQVNIVLSDGVNGSSVDGSYIDISKTKDGSSVSRVLVRNGNVKVNLKKNDFYDFKVEGQNTDYSHIRYAASNVISYYIDEKTKTVPIVQFPLQRITRPSEAPSITEFKFGDAVLNVGEEHTTDQMKNIDIKVLTSSIIKELSYNSPLPMLAIGFVPTTADAEKKDVVNATQYGKTVKNTDGKFESVWNWHSLSAYKLIKGDVFDVVIVLYDVANNRLEYHFRLKTSDSVAEDESIKISDLNMRFESYPTPSNLFSIDRDAFTKNSSHYSNTLGFKVKKDFNHIACLGFDVYRKCVDDGEDFRLIKHFVYKTPKISSNSSEHTLSDNDGELEDEKTYQYKIVAYTFDGKKSKLESSPMLELKVPKSTSLLLVSPVNVAITKDEAKGMDYVFKFSNPKILETAKEIRLGFLISDRQGNIPYCLKFKYVFNDPKSSGKDEIYFAARGDEKMYQGQYYYGTDYSKKRNSITNKQLEDLIQVDKTTGTVSLKKDFTSLGANLAKEPRSISYIEGGAYYWDILDWGADEYSDSDDFATKIISDEKNGVVIVSYTNDFYNGNNAWNGRGEFTIRFD